MRYPTFFRRMSALVLLVVSVATLFGLSLAGLSANPATARPLSILGWVGQMFPSGGATHSVNRGMPFTIFVQVYKEGVTNASTTAPGANIACTLQWGQVMDFGASWNVTNTVVMSYNRDMGNNDEYMGTITPTIAGKYEYTAFCTDTSDATSLAQDVGNARLLVLTRTVFVQLFEWTWIDVAEECERFLGPKGFGAVQVSPAMEHALVTTATGGPVDYPWWQRYQPVSYKIESRSGTRAEFAEMVARCKAAGVDIYADAVINHMANLTGLAGGNGLGSAGTVYQHKNYPGLYTSADFHDCGAPGDQDNKIQPGDYSGNADRVRTCELENLADLKTDNPAVRAKITAYLNDLLSLSVSGFRIDAAKHMGTNDIHAMLGGLITAPFVFNEVIASPGEAIADGQYQDVGHVSEFEYGNQLAQKFRQGNLAVFKNGDILFAFDWDNFLPSYKAVVFSDNHDNQRGHGGGGNPLTYRDGQLYLLGNVFMLAWPYGYPALMSSYTIPDLSIRGNDAVGPPSNGSGHTRPVYSGTTPLCANFYNPQPGQWICEHRQPAIANMVGFRNHTAEAPNVAHWWSNGSNQIAFSRHDGTTSQGFVVINRDETDQLNRQFQTGLPAGVYCNIIDGEKVGDACTGSAIVVDDRGQAQISVPPMNAVAIHGAAMLSEVAATDMSLAMQSAPSPAVAGQPISYTMVITNAGNDVTGAILSDTVPAAVTHPTWRCVSAGGVCGALTGSGSLSQTFDLADGGVITYTLTGVLAANAVGTVVNVARVALPSPGLVDLNASNDTATDSIVPLDEASGSRSVTLAGNFQGELGCTDAGASLAGDWEPACPATHLTYLGQGIWRGEFALPPGRWEYKIALNDSWTESYRGNHGVNNNTSLDLSSGPALVRFYFDAKTKAVLDSVMDKVAVAAGTFQSELGCPEMINTVGGDWEPPCVRTLMTDPDGDGVYTLWADNLPPGHHRFKVVRDEAWLISYPGFDVEFQISRPGEPVQFSWNSATTEVGAVPAKTGALWIDEATLAWKTDHGPNGVVYRLHYDPDSGLRLRYDNMGQLSLGSRRNLSVTLTFSDTLRASAYPKFPNAGSYKSLKLAPADVSRVADILKGQMALAVYDRQGKLLETTGVQIQGVLDDKYTYSGNDLGVTFAGGQPTLKLWAPTARSVTLHRFADSQPATPALTAPLTLDPATGVWSISGDTSWQDEYYLYEVEVYVPAMGQAEKNLVTDPYAVSLSVNPFEDGQPAHTQRSQMVDLFGDPSLKLPGWDSLAKPALAAPEDIVVYEVHMRDFSINDSSVADADRGTFKAFTYDGRTGRPLSNGMRHLINLAEAGLTHVHLLPIADSGVMVEDKSQQLTTPDLSEYSPAAPDQQAAVGLIRQQDGFNWGYETQHYAAPEGAYATDPNGSTRILEFREMVKALNENGLRLVMDGVYNHTYRAGQNSGSVLDKIVPGYYHRLDAAGNIEQKSCCPDTATEFAMMEKLMVDTVLLWAKAYKVDSFRFDLMNFHTRQNLVKVKEALQSLTPARDGADGRKIYVYGEGWDFGGAKDKGFVHANQFNMAGTGMGTFNDRLRDAVHGGYGDLYRQGFINGLFYDPNGHPYANQGQGDLRLAMDKIRVGLAGNLQNYQFVDQAGNTVAGKALADTGYTLDPQEAVHYISKHDNETLFDLNVYKAPLGANGSNTTSMADRVRIQNLGLSLVGLAQGIPFFDLGGDMLRSKSLDRDSYDSGDWFNQVDFTYQSNNFGVGLPPAWRNDPTTKWPVMKPLLENIALKPNQADILNSVEHFQEILQIRRSSKLFHLETETDIQARLQFHNTGPDQINGLIVMSISDTSGVELDPNYEQVVVLFNATPQTQTLTIPSVVGRNFALHPVQAASFDPLVRIAGFDADNGKFTIPARTTAVFVEE